MCGFSWGEVSVSEHNCEHSSRVDCDTDKRNLLKHWCPRYELTYDKRFRNGSKTFLKRLGVSNGFPVFLSVSGS